jgi:hypothetical protein
LRVKGLQYLSPLLQPFLDNLKKQPIIIIMADFIVLNGEIVALIEDLDLQLVHVYSDNSAEIPLF